MNILQKINLAVKVLIDQDRFPDSIALTNSDYEELCKLTDMEEVNQLIVNDITLHINKDFESSAMYSKDKFGYSLDFLIKLSQIKQPTIWFDKTSVGNWMANELHNHGFSYEDTKIAVEVLTGDYAVQLQRAYAKGWERAYNEAKQSDVTSYVYYPKTLEEVEKLNNQNKNQMRVIVLAFTLKGQSQEKILAKIIEVAKDYPNHILVHGFMPRYLLVEKGIPTDVVDTLTANFPIRLNMHDGKRVLRTEMAMIAKKLDAQIVVIGNISEGVKEEIDLYISAGLISYETELRHYHLV